MLIWRETAHTLTVRCKVNKWHVLVPCWQPSPAYFSKNNIENFTSHEEFEDARVTANLILPRIYGHENGACLSVYLVYLFLSMFTGKCGRVLRTWIKMRRCHSLWIVCQLLVLSSWHTLKLCSNTGMSSDLNSGFSPLFFHFRFLQTFTVIAGL